MRLANLDSCPGEVHPIAWKATNTDNANAAMNPAVPANGTQKAVPFRAIRRIVKKSVTMKPTSGVAIEKSQAIVKRPYSQPMSLLEPQLSVLMISINPANASPAAITPEAPNRITVAVRSPARATRPLESCSGFTNSGVASFI